MRWLVGWQWRGHGVLSSPERQPSVPNNQAPILGEVCASRTGVRVGPRSAPLFRSQDTSVPPRAAWVRLPEPFGSILGVVFARRPGVRIPFRAPRGRRSYDTVVRPQALWLPAVWRSGGCRSAARSYAVPGTGDSDSRERQASGCGHGAPVLGDVCASCTGVRVLSWAARETRSHDTVVRPRAACGAAVS